MQNIAEVEIADHPTKGYKRKVEITGLDIDAPGEVIELRTVCTYYENVDGNYGEPVSTPIPIIINRPLYARTAGDNVVFVKATTGEVVLRKLRDVQEPIPVEEQVEGGPTTRTISQEYWVLKSNEATEVPVEEITKMFFFLIALLSTPTALKSLMIQFVLDEVQLGTWDQVGR